MSAAAPSAKLDAYWRTVQLMSDLFTSAKIQHVFVKVARVYPFADSNVDVLIEREDAERVLQLLTESEWRHPSLHSWLIQRAVEPWKLKLPARRASLVSAHLYMGVQWRYQAALELRGIPTSCKPVHTLAVAPVAVSGETEVRVFPDWVDVVLQSCEVAFENFGLSEGQAYDIAGKLRSLTEEEGQTAAELAAANGASEALRLVSASSKWLSVNSLGGAHSDRRVPLAMRDLARVWACRSGWLVRQRRYLRALAEFAGCGLFAVGMRVKESLRPSSQIP